MKCLNRNKRMFFYAGLKGKIALTDDYGNRNGEYRLVYDPPVSAEANISVPTGETEVLPFGGNVDYDKIIVLDDPAFPIDEYTILWVDSAPEVDEEGHTETPHDYVVKKVARSLNSMSVAISKVTVRG